MSQRIVSGDSNLWCREFESGILDDPEDHAVPEHMYRWSTRKEPDATDVVEVRFGQGVPVAVDGVEMPLLELVQRLNVRVSAFGLGRYSGLEHLDHGEKVLEVREMPAAWLLLRSYRHLKTATLEAETIREKMHLEQLWVREAVEGRWFGELRGALQCFVDACAQRVSGSVRWKLSMGSAETRAILADEPPLPARQRDRHSPASMAGRRTSISAPVCLNDSADTGTSTASRWKSRTFVDPQLIIVEISFVRVRSTLSYRLPA